MSDCVFCEIVAGDAPARIVEDWLHTIVFHPLDPVTEGHLLVIPKRHVEDFTTDPITSAVTMLRAAEYAHEAGGEYNLITSKGANASQSVFHLHVHLVPRRAGDQLMLPWGTTGDPHAPHWCKVAQGLKDQLDGALS